MFELKSHFKCNKIVETVFSFNSILCDSLNLQLLTSQFLHKALQNFKIRVETKIEIIKLLPYIYVYMKLYSHICIYVCMEHIYIHTLLI